MKRWLCDKHFDFIIGSVHYLDHCLIDHALFSTSSIERVYRTYFAEIQYSIDAHLFDIIGHFDLVRRYIAPKRIRLSHFDYDQLLEHILQELVRQRLYLELNLKGLREAINEPTPRNKIIFRFFKMGGHHLSIGSDAHSVLELSEAVKNIRVWQRNNIAYKFTLPFQ